MLLLRVLRFETWRCDLCARRFPQRRGVPEPTPMLPALSEHRPVGAELHELDDDLRRSLKADLRDEQPLPAFDVRSPDTPRKRSKSG